MTDSSAYAEFIAKKLTRSPATGLAVVPPLLAALKPHQRDLTAWSLRRGRSAIFADTGLGKMIMELEWSRVVAAHTGGDVLILAPLAVARQIEAEGVKFGIAVTRCQDQSDVRSGINVTNYDRLHLFDASKFIGVVLDECFAAGTEVEIVTHDGEVAVERIENLRVGMYVRNAAGVDVIKDVHRREVPYAIRLHIDGRAIIVSPNHPFFTQRGWVGAQDLAPSDRCVSTSSAMRLVRSAILPSMEAVGGSGTSEVLRSILFSEMAHEHAGAQGQGAYASGCEEERRDAGSSLHGGRPVTRSEPRTNAGDELHGGPRSEGEGVHPIESHEPQTFRAWGERAWFDGAADDDARCVRTDLGSGVQFVTGPTDSRLSDLLQDRHRASRQENRDRGGWELPLQSEGEGHEEGCGVDFARVDRLEVLESGHPDLERLRSPDGKLYFYDIGATRHPSFTVNGLLVHNSGCIKHHETKTLKMLLEAFATTPWKLCGSATPAPNDWTELGTHAEFLGVCSRTEMLAEFFCHDGGETQVWRLKGHAKGAFWRFVATWAAMVRRPSDLGHDDAEYDLPPLHVEEHIIPADAATVRESGLLFAEEAKSLMERRTARKASRDSRVTAAVEFVRAAWKEDNPSEPWLIWCDLNAEQDALEDAFGDLAFSVRGSNTTDEKEAAVLSWLNGDRPVMISKSAILGWGLNFQHCARTVFVGVTDSWEAYYQAVRRFWRFGQKRAVHVHIFASEVEGAVVANLKRKELAALAMAEALSAETRDAVRAEVIGQKRVTNAHKPSRILNVPEWLSTETE